MVSYSYWRKWTNIGFLIYRDDLQEIVYKGKPLHVIMKDDSKALEEVVIIGYQTVKKSDLTGAVAVVDTKEMKKSSAGTLCQSDAGACYRCKRS